MQSSCARAVTSFQHECPEPLSSAGTLATTTTRLHSICCMHHTAPHRAPCAAHIVVLQVGSGVQIFCTFVVTLCLASAGFLSPASRGALLTSAIILYLLLAITAGYAAVWLWANMTRSLDGWTGVCLKTACYFPGARRCARCCRVWRLLRGCCA